MSVRASDVPRNCSGAKIAQCSHYVAAVRQVASFLFRQAKIGDPDYAVGIKKQVRRFDVAMQNTLGVGMC